MIERRKFLGTSVLRYLILKKVEKEGGMNLMDVADLVIGSGLSISSEEPVQLVAHATKIIRDMIDAKLLERKEDKLYPTEKGKKLREDLDKFVQAFGFRIEVVE